MRLLLLLLSPAALKYAWVSNKQFFIYEYICDKDFFVEIVIPKKIHRLLARYGGAKPVLFFILRIIKTLIMTNWCYFVYCYVSLYCYQVLNIKNSSVLIWRVIFNISTLVFVMADLLISITLYQLDVWLWQASVANITFSGHRKICILFTLVLRRTNGKSTAANFTLIMTYQIHVQQFRINIKNPRKLDRHDHRGKTIRQSCQQQWSCPLVIYFESCSAKNLCGINNLSLYCSWK